MITSTFHPNLSLPMLYQISLQWSSSNIMKLHGLECACELYRPSDRRLFQYHIKINFNHIRYLYNEDERALPGNLRNLIYEFLAPAPPPPPPEEEVVSLTISPPSLSPPLPLSFRFQRNVLYSFCNPILFAICTSTFSKLCINVYSGM
jgi:hypothetical protein